MTAGYKVRSSIRKANTFIGLGALLLLLGAGNILYGHLKSQRDLQMISEMRLGVSELADQTVEAEDEDTDSDSSVYQQKLPSADETKRSAVKNEKEFNSRLHYYRFSILGGKCFLALAGICFALSLVFTQRDTGADNEVPTAQE